MLRWITRLFRWTWRTAWVVTFVLMLLFNAAVLTIEAVASVVASVIDTIPGVQSVYDRQTRRAASITARADAQERRASQQAARAARLEGDLGQERKLRITASNRSAKLASELQSAKVGQAVTKIDNLVVKDRVQTITRRVSARTAQTTFANVSSMVGEGVPVWGVAVIVSTTAYEVTSACQTMADMDSLRIALDPSAQADPDTLKVCGIELPTTEELLATVKSVPGVIWDRMPSLEDMDAAGDHIAEGAAKMGESFLAGMDKVGASAATLGNDMLNSLDQVNRDFELWWSTE